MHGRDRLQFFLWIALALTLGFSTLDYYLDGVLVDRLMDTAEITMWLGLGYAARWEGEERRESSHAAPLA